MKALMIGALCATLAWAVPDAHGQPPIYTIQQFQASKAGTPIGINNKGILLSSRVGALVRSRDGGVLWSASGAKSLHFTTAGVPHGLNDRATVVGSDTLNGVTGAALWEPSAHGMSERILPAASASCTGGSAVAVNNSGTAIGSMAAASQTDYCGAVFWPAGAASAMVLPPLYAGTVGGYAPSEGVAVNNLGDAAGNAFYVPAPGNQVMHAVVWPSGGGVVDLGALISATTWSYAAGVNDAGTVLGYYDLSGQSHAIPFIWNAASGMEAIPLPTDARYMLFQPLPVINNHGTVAGTYAGAEHNNGFIWTQQDGTTSLLTLLDPSDPLSATIYQVYVYGLNDAGQLAVTLYSVAADGSTSEIPAVLTPKAQ